MNRFKVSETGVAKELRERYLNSLSEPQEFFLESIVSSGEAWVWENNAYAIVADNTLVEFYVGDAHSRNLLALFDEVVSCAGITKVFCKSFDTQLLFAALSNHEEVSTLGFMFRKIDSDSFAKDDSIVDRLGTMNDVNAILEINDDFFDSKEEVVSYIQSDNLFVFEYAGEMIGCGIASKVNAGYEHIDIGMLVAPCHRGLGYGAYIVSFLKDHFLKRGYRPICGCGVDNIASQKTLAKAGFVCEHRILQIELNAS